MIFDMVCRLRPDTLVLHSGCSDIMVSFKLSDIWLERAISFWKEEIARYGEKGVRVVIENIVEESPEALIALVDEVGSEWLGLCLDVGHAHLRSPLKPGGWVEKMGKRLKHVHLHDNHGTTDEHLPVGKGTIDFDPFFTALYEHAPDATVSLEVVAEPEAVVENLRMVIGTYRTKA